MLTTSQCWCSFFSSFQTISMPMHNCCGLWTASAHQTAAVTVPSQPTAMRGLILFTEFAAFSSSSLQPTAEAQCRIANRLRGRRSKSFGSIPGRNKRVSLSRHLWGPPTLLLKAHRGLFPSRDRGVQLPARFHLVH